MVIYSAHKMKQIAIMVENSRAYGRAMIEGIAAHAQELRDWALRPISAKDATATRLTAFDGIIARIADRRLAQRIIKSHTPCVDVFCQRQYQDIIGVDSDHRKIASLACDFFRLRGFHNLAYCGFPGLSFSDARERTFASKDVFSYHPSHHQQVDDSQFYAERIDRIPDFQSLRRWIKSLPKPVAVFCCNDLRALQLQQATLAENLHIPNDVAILGVDDDTILCSFAKIPISSINPNSFMVGYEAARLLSHRMETRHSPRKTTIHRVKPGSISERASSEFMPIDPPWFGEVLMHIERNLRRPIGASEIFELSQRSSTYVEQVFKKRLGKSVQQYITSTKMLEAKRLLSDPSLRISEIAYRCGFSSPQYFCRTFSAAFNLNPKTYRKKQVALGIPSATSFIA